MPLPLWTILCAFVVPALVVGLVRWRMGYNREGAGRLVDSGLLLTALAGAWTALAVWREPWGVDVRGAWVWLVPLALVVSWTACLDNRAVRVASWFVAGLIAGLFAWFFAKPVAPFMSMDGIALWTGLGLIAGPIFLAFVASQAAGCGRPQVRRVGVVISLTGTALATLLLSSAQHTFMAGSLVALACALLVADWLRTAPTPGRDVSSIFLHLMGALVMASAMVLTDRSLVPPASSWLLAVIPAAGTVAVLPWLITPTGNRSLILLILSVLSMVLLAGAALLLLLPEASSDANPYGFIQLSGQCLA